MTTATVSKMQQAVTLFNDIFTVGYQLNGKTQRAEFIERAKAEIGLTQAGASTYYQNISNKVNKGMKLYHYNKPSKKVNKADIKTAEQQVMSSIGQHRWMTVNSEGVEVDSFTSRAAAQSHAKDNGLKWKDRQKAA